MTDEAMLQALEATARINAIEDRIALEIFGCSYDELNEDDKDYVLCQIDC